MNLRRTFLLSLALLAAAALAGYAVLLRGIDLDDVRRQLELRLSTALARPVRLGEARFSLRHGPAFSFTDLRLEAAAEHDWTLNAERLYLRLAPSALLHGDVVFDRIVLQAPHFRIPVSPQRASSRALPDFTGRFPEIRSLALREGTIAVVDYRHSPHRPLMTLAEIDARVTDLAPGRPGWLSLSAKLQQPSGVAEVRLGGEIVPAADWRRIQGRLGLKLEGWEPGSLLRSLAPATNVTGKASLNVTVAGTAAEGMRFQADLAGTELAVGIFESQTPVPVSIVQLQGTWRSEANGGKVEDLEVVIDEVTGRGAVSWQGGWSDLHLDASVSTPRLPLASYLQWLPDRPGRRLREQIRSGFLEVRSARFSGPVATLRETGNDVPMEAVLAVDGLNFSGPGEDLRDVRFSAALRPAIIEVRDGSLLLDGNSVRFDGSVRQPFAPLPEFALQAAGEVESDRLLKLFSPDPRPELEVAGPCRVEVRAAGTIEKFATDFRADLKGVRIRHDRDLLKLAGEEGELQGAAAVTPERFELREGQLRLPVLQVRGKGQLERKEEKAFQLNLDLTAPDLEAARSRLGFLDKVRARGGIAVQLQIAGDKGKIHRRSGRISLKKTGMHLAGAVADVTEAEGVIHIAGDRLEFDRLTALLGTSPVVVSGSVNRLEEPEVHLLVRAKAIRADELIFRSPTMYLRDIEGELRIDRQRVRFERIGVRLDGGTRAVVRGSVENFQEPLVGLEIEAAEGNIDEVIALWIGPAPPKKEGGLKVRVQITARVREGRLGPLRFREAAGEITHADGELSIFPLRFTTGGGRCTGRVLVGTAQSPASLQVSGHVDGMDAAALQSELLQRRGLVTGRLKGDFSLEGRIGPTFLETSRGGFSLDIEEGVLRKFKSLGRVFSLLNVSQIVALQLPDMAREGMPFERLTGTFHLEKGVLVTEDLFVDSNAMNLSVVGQIDLRTEELDFILGVKPLRTVDKIVTRIPLAGWILAGEEKALITAHFQVRGPAGDPDVMPIPITSISEKVVGIFRRVFGLPGKVIEGVGEFVRPD